jgi:hypothetical protein
MVWCLYSSFVHGKDLLIHEASSLPMLWMVELGAIMLGMAEEVYAMQIP